MAGRVGIIGMGWVGTSVAISTLHRGLATELLVHDVRQDVAEGEAMDLAQGALFYSRAATVRPVDLEALCEADVVVIAAGRGGTADQSRLDLLRDNARLTREIGTRLRGARGILIMVTNPVDLLTQVLQEETGAPVERVIGTGTILDTARLRRELAQELRVHPQSVHAQVVGEHGDSEVTLFSSATVGGGPLRGWPDWTEAREADVRERVRRAAYEIIRRKGATNHAIGLVTAALIGAILKDERRVLTVSRLHEEVQGVERVALSLPTTVGRHGAVEVLSPTLSEGEAEELEASARLLKTEYGRL
jgi:L-lactate dehydrogenase